MEILKNLITQAIGTGYVEILDPRKDGVHLEAIVVSELFVGLPLLKRHRLVMSALKEKFKQDLHALAVKTYTPQEWEDKQHDL